MLEANQNSVTENTLSHILFPKEIQALLNALVFFLAFPSLTIFSNSITFYIFIVIVFRTGAFWLLPGKGRILFASFIAVLFITTLLAPYDDMPRGNGFEGMFTIVIQWVYWILLAVFFTAYRYRINYFEISKWLFYGTLAATLGFYFIRINFSLGFMAVICQCTRNAFVFTLLSTIPFCFYYLKKAAHPNNLKLYFLFFFLDVLFTNGRSGAVIIIVELLLVASVIYPTFQKTARVAFLALFLMYFMNESAVLKPFKNALADTVEPINPRFAGLLRGEEGSADGDLSFDRSWLLRIVMIEKSFEIMDAHPVFGIGPNNFIYYDAPLTNLSKYERMSNLNLTYLNSRSAHNSYIQVLSEFGITGLVILILLVLIPTISFFKTFFTSVLTSNQIPMISLLGISMHYYAISSITGAVGWMVFGIAWSMISNLHTRNF